MMKNYTTRLFLAFATVYVVWGSTYLAMRIGATSQPPVLFAGLRFAIAGVIMLIYCLVRGHALPREPADWVKLATTSVLMCVLGNALSTWGTKWVPSNLAALICSSAALWTAWLGSLGGAGERLSRLTVVGLLLGFAGVGVLVSEGLLMRDAPPAAYAALIVAPICWAAASIVGRRHPAKCSFPMTAALHMCISGVILSAVAFALGDFGEWNHAGGGYMALAYLIIAGSCISYAAFLWLVQQPISPALLGTYGFVNPAVAVLLGWWLLEEQLSRTQIAGTVVILIALLAVTAASRRPREKKATVVESPPTLANAA